MYLDVKYRGLDRNDHFRFFSHCRLDKARSRKIRSTRTVIQAYLYAIQSRLNRKHLKGATALYNRLIEIINAEYWVALAIKNELDLSPIKLK